MDSQASQITGYSFKPFIDLTPEEASRLSAMTRNAKHVIYTRGFLVNTQKNKNGWRITDNKYIEANRGIAAGRPINYGPKMLGKAHHPNFYHDLDLSDKTPEQARKEFLAYQEWSRIGDILRIDYDSQNDKWLFYGAISHPNIVEAVQKKELELPKYVSPYFWNLNDPEKTGDEINEAELFHVSFVDDPAYGPEVATIDAMCDSSTGGACAAQVFGLPASSIIKIAAKKPSPCMCGLMASYEHKLGSAFYVENPTQLQTQDMSDSTPPQSTENKTNNTQQEIPKDQAAREAALKTMKKYDELANSGKDLDNKAIKTEDPKNPTIPVEYQDVLNMAIEKDREENAKLHAKALKEKDDIIASMQETITKYETEGRERILDSYIDKDSFKDEKEYNERRSFYSNLCKELKMTNAQLEELMKGHYQVQEVKYMKNKNKGQGAGTVTGSEDKNMDPFGFDSREDNGFGKLSSSTPKRGLEAASNDDDNTEEDTSKASAILGAF